MLKRIFIFTTVLALLGARVVAAEDKVDFEKQIQPIFAENCGKCHGKEKAAGKLKLDSPTGIKEKWDADKELLVAGDPDKSELYQRLTLPADDKKRMPKGADPLAKDKIDLIAKWIKEGAVLPAVAAVAAADAAKPAATEAPKKDEKPKEIPLPKVSAAPKEAIDKLTAAGAQVMPLYVDSYLLTVSFAHRSEPAGDAEIALLSGVAEQVYGLNLSESKSTETGLAPLAQLKNLAELHLEKSNVTDAGLAHVKGLGNLQYLNLFGTGITDAGLAHLKELKNLRKLYLWQTKVNYDPAMQMEKDIPGLMVNLGYNHPVVMKKRLTKEFEVAKKQAEEAKAEEGKAQQQFEAAKKNVEATSARLADIDKQLNEVDPERRADAEKAAAEAKAAAAKAAAAKAAADKAAADKAAADKAAADKAAADKAAADKAAADKATADKAAAEKKAAEEKAAADKAAADKAAAEKKAAEEKAAAEKKAAEEKKAADEKAAADAEKK